MIAAVLVETTSPIVNVYSSHATQVWNIFVANNDEINVLVADDCKANAFEGNDYAITSSGFRSSNCITAYNKKVANETKLVNDKLREITIEFDDVSLSVFRAYLPLSNPMVHGEAIERKINETYSETVVRWNNVRPDINAMRISFVANLNAFALTLQTCFNSAKTYMQTLSDLLRDQVTECVTYSGSRRDLFIEALKNDLLKAAETIEMFKFD